jgi:hypothetical protein
MIAQLALGPARHDEDGDHGVRARGEGTRRGRGDGGREPDRRGPGHRRYGTEVRRVTSGTTASVPSSQVAIAFGSLPSDTWTS